MFLRGLQARTVVLAQFDEFGDTTTSSYWPIPQDNHTIWCYPFCTCCYESFNESSPLMLDGEGLASVWRGPGDGLNIDTSMLLRRLLGMCVSAASVDIMRPGEYNARTCGQEKCTVVFRAFNPTLHPFEVSTVDHELTSPFNPYLWRY